MALDDQLNAKIFLIEKNKLRKNQSSFDYKKRFHNFHNFSGATLRHFRSAAQLLKASGPSPWEVSSPPEIVAERSLLEHCKICSANSHCEFRSSPKKIGNIVKPYHWRRALSS